MSVIACAGQLLHYCSAAGPGCRVRLQAGQGQTCQHTASSRARVSRHRGRSKLLKPAAGPAAAPHARNRSLCNITLLLLVALLVEVMRRSEVIHGAAGEQLQAHHAKRPHITGG